TRRRRRPRRLLHRRRLRVRRLGTRPRRPPGAQGDRRGGHADDGDPHGDRQLRADVPDRPLVGSIAPGRYAARLLVDDLEACGVDRVVSKGELGAEGGRMLHEPTPPDRTALTATMRRTPVSADDIAAPAPADATSVRVLSMDLDREV